MSKNILIIVGVILLILGILGIIPAMGWAAESLWRAIIEMIMGVLAILVSFMDKKKQ